MAKKKKAAAPKPVQVNLKRIAKPLDSITRQLEKVILKGTSKNAVRAALLKGVLGVVRNNLQGECENNRWFIDF